MNKNPKFLFPEKLVEGLIKSRPNRFIMMVEINREVLRCHCPSTGRIGNIVFKDVPCLLSKSRSTERKTPYTVEAISLDSGKKKSWMGINQVNANRYIEFFLRNGMLERMAGKSNEISREVELGKSRIDFKIGNTYLEIKTPLIMMPKKAGAPEIVHSKFNSFERLIKHFRDMGRSVGKGSKAVLAMCYIYDARPFKPPKGNSDSRIKRAARKSLEKGLEHWQINLKIDENGVELRDYFMLHMFD